jgi:hypothetical protein
MRHRLTLAVLALAAVVVAQTACIHTLFAQIRLMQDVRALDAVQIRDIGDRVIEARCLCKKADRN